MQIHKLRILRASARVELSKAYECEEDGNRFDFLAYIYVRCRRIAGIPSPYDAQIDKMAEIDARLEEASGEAYLPFWRGARVFMAEIVRSGEVQGDENVERTATFIQLVEQKLATDVAAGKRYSAEGDYLPALLHPVIIASSLPQLQAGHLRDAVLNAFVAIGDLLRTRTGLTLDGKALVEQALSPQNPMLILSTLGTDSGRNDQLGFMQILAGAFVGVRNPKAHSLLHDLDVQKAIHYLFFASLLARRVTEATQAKPSEP